MFLQPVIPWSFRSLRKMNNYVVTHGGYLIKVQEDETKFPCPTRAFRLKDCMVLEGLPTEDGTLSFWITGINCCRGFLTGNILDRRSHWKFIGSESEVKTLLFAMRQKMPVMGYLPVL